VTGPPVDVLESELYRPMIRADVVPDPVEYRTTTLPEGGPGPPTCWEALPMNEAATHVPGNRPRTPGGPVPSDDELFRGALAFSGSYVSDDGTVMISRSVGQAFCYSGDRFVGRCAICARAALMPAAGEPLSDVTAAVRFIALHDHGVLD
jgi:hypothetical protein